MLVDLSTRIRSPDGVGVQRRSLSDYIELESGWERHGSRNGAYYLAAAPCALDALALSVDLHDSFARHRFRAKDFALISGRRDWELTPLLIFEWEAFGPGGCLSSGLHSLDLGVRRRYICLHNEHDSWMVIAAADPECSVLADLFVLLMRRNAMAFTRLPDRTENHTPRAIGPGVICGSYFRWVATHGTWKNLREALRSQGRAGLPSSATRQGHRNLDECVPFRAGHEKHEDRLTAAQDHATFWKYFMLSYREV
jgi:hypothetical protein